MKIIFYIPVFSILCGSATAQDSLKKPFFIKLYSLSASGCLWNYGQEELLDVSEVQEMAGKNAIVKNHSANLKLKNNYYYPGAEGGGASLTTGFVFYNKRKKDLSNRYELKLGLSYQKRDEQQFRLENTEQIPFDTLISNSSPDVYYIDTVRSQTVEYKYNKSQLSGHVVFTIHSLQNRILSLYTGIGLSAGFNTEQSVEASYRFKQSFEDQFHHSHNYNPELDLNTYEKELTKIKGGYIIMAYVPLGTQVRFSHSRKGYVTRFALNAEVDIGFKKEQFPNKELLSDFRCLQLGLKFFLNREEIVRNYRLKDPFY
jgi:hypothetical protein